MKPSVAAAIRHAIVPQLLLAAALLQGCVNVAPAHQSSQDIADLSVRADKWDKAIVRKDRAAIEENMTQDFRQIDGRGNIEARHSFVEGLMDPELEIDPYAVEEFQVRLYGDVALLSGRTKMTGRYEGKPFQSHYRYIDIYVRGSQGWKIVSVQISKLPN